MKHITRQDINKIYLIKECTNQRLNELGILPGTIIRVVKYVAGMLQLRVDGSDIAIREETGKDIKVLL
jgi:Fe2+ transport system protein FeoA|tara:strand:- start:2 stop:205 length:204 start_codon:yes stop_codon:yes gene_type:complete